ncbi:hypothetical protein K440DRAFT_214078 [Wilcoxina mikolae CBS 423.85]|nr:hypothetical protein K440DRAFT_214078 [Wilcoxina mikolae CBS 423.85]
MAIFFFFTSQDIRDADGHIYTLFAEAPCFQVPSTGSSSMAQSSFLTSDMTIRELIVFSAWHALKSETVRTRKGYTNSIPVQIRQPNYKAIFTKNLQPAEKPNEGRGKRIRKPPTFFVPGDKIVLHRTTFIPMSPADYTLPDGTFIRPQYSGIYLESDPICDTDIQKGISTERCGRSDISSEGYAHSDGTKSSDPGYHTDEYRSEELDIYHLHLNVFAVDRLLNIHSLSLSIVEQIKADVLIASSSGGYKFLLKAYCNHIHLIQELRAYSLLRHLQGHTVPICYGVFSCGADMWLVLEYVDYRSLRTGLHIFAKGQLKKLRNEALGAIQEIYYAGVAHGDIRVDNVLEDPNYERGVVLVDFELSCFAGDKGVESVRKEDFSGMGWLFGEGLRDL